MTSNARPLDHTFVWVDIETTGLVPEGGALLEVGIVITDHKLGEVARKAWVVPFRPGWCETPPDDYVLEMHTKSGLWEECLATAGTPTAYDQERAICRFLNEHGIERGAAPKDNHPMCGSSVHFDRLWLTHHMPSVLPHFAYRNIDVSTIKELLVRWDEGGPTEPPKREKHRVLPDLEDTIALAGFYKEYLFS